MRWRFLVLVAGFALCGAVRAGVPDFVHAAAAARVDIR